MRDFFEWNRIGLDAESLYFYSTLMRMVYQHDTDLWQQLVDAVDFVSGFEMFPAIDPLDSGWAMIYGSTGSVIVVEGTTFLIQWLPNVLGVPPIPHGGFEGLQGEYFWNVFTAMEEPVIDAFRRHPAGRKTLCGHSLGGACALLLGVRAKTYFNETFNGVITEGMPRVGTRSFAESINFDVLRLQNTKDQIANLPPANTNLVNYVFDGFPPFRIINAIDYVHPGRFMRLEITGEMHYGVGEAWVSGDGYPPPPPPLSRSAIDHSAIVPHNSFEYTRRLRLRLLRAPYWRHLRTSTIRVLDEINWRLNQIDAVDWGINPTTGELTVWEQEVLGKPPSRVSLVNAVDP